MITNSLCYILPKSVGDSNPSLSSEKGINIIVGIRLDLVIHVPFKLLSILVKSSNELVKHGCFVHIVPERFSIVWVLVPVEFLLSSIVNNRNTHRSHSECNHILVVAKASRERMRTTTSLLTQESWVIMIINEQPQRRQVTQ